SSQDNGITAATTWSQPFPASLIPPAASVSHDPSQANGNQVTWYAFGDNRGARVQGVGAGVERQIPYGIIVKADYVGKFIHGLPTNSGTVEYDNPPLSGLSLGDLLNQDINSPDPAIQAQIAAHGIKLPYPGFTGSVSQALRPYPQYIGVEEISPSG